jgi:hypothetical protein
VKVHIVVVRPAHGKDDMTVIAPNLHDVHCHSITVTPASRKAAVYIQPSSAMDVGTSDSCRVWQSCRTTRISGNCPILSLVAFR